MPVIGKGGQVIPGAQTRVVSQTAPAQVATANATDLATAQALANQLKTTVNQLLTALTTAGVLK